MNEKIEEELRNRGYNIITENHITFFTGKGFIEDMESEVASILDELGYKGTWGVRGPSKKPRKIPIYKEEVDDDIKEDVPIPKDETIKDPAPDIPSIEETKPNEPVKVTKNKGNAGYSQLSLEDFFNS